MPVPRMIPTFIEILKNAEPCAWKSPTIPRGTYATGPGSATTRGGL